MPEMTSGGFGGTPSIDGLRRIVPWVLLGAMLLVMYSVFSQFKVSNERWQAANANKAGLIATPTASALLAQKPKPKPYAGPWVVMIVSVNFRKSPSASSDTISGFDAGQRVELVTKVGDWYKVKDKKGRVGWVTALPDYTKVVKK